MDDEDGLLLELPPPLPASTPLLPVDVECGWVEGLLLLDDVEEELLSDRFGLLPDTDSF